MNARIGLILLSALAQVGCFTKPDHSIMISTDPAGAQIYANEVLLGVSPLTIAPNDVFPPRWKDYTYQAHGRLVIKKPGCKSYSASVNDAMISRDIHVGLTCDGATGQQTTTPALAPAGEVSRTVQPSPASNHTVERLKNLEQLRQQGLVTEQEYQAIRNRILSEL